MGSAAWPLIRIGAGRFGWLGSLHRVLGVEQVWKCTGWEGREDKKRGASCLALQGLGRARTNRCRCLRSDGHSTRGELIHP